MADGTAALDTVFSALGLPEAARVGQRIPRSEFDAVLAPPARRALAKAVESIRLAYALSPASTGLSASLRDGIDSSTLAVLSLRAKPDATETALRHAVALVHGAMPYPLLVAAAVPDGSVFLSLAAKRMSADGRQHVVLADGPAFEPLPPKGAVRDAFLAAAALPAFPGNTLWLLHDFWLGLLPALAAARETGAFRVPVDAAALRADLAELASLDATLRSLRAKARAGASIAQRIELNAAIKGRRREREELLAKIAAD